MTDLKQTYKNLTEKIVKLYEEAQEAAKQAIAEETAEYFKKYSNLVHAIVWKQYTSFTDEDYSFYKTEPYLVAKYDSLTEDDDWQDTEENYDFNFEETLEELETRLKDVLEYEKDPEVYVKDKPEVGPYYNKISYYAPYETSTEVLTRITRIKQYPEDFVEKSKELLSFIENLDEDIAKNLFGDGVKIIITSDNVEFEGYSEY